MIIFHDPHCVEYSAPGHPERPERITRTVPVLKDRHRDWEWREPHPAKERNLLRAHSRDHVEQIRTAVHDFDVDTPVYPRIYDHAILSAGAAIETALAGVRGERIAIWDFDAHHGNVTEDVVANNPRISFASIHQFPAYPGTGAKSFENIDNYPVPPQTPRKEHVDVAKRALDKLLSFKPSLILVSAGFDAYARDPLVQMTLEREDFATFGEWLNKTDIPTAAILEGGYSDDLPELIDAFLSAWAA